jgi:hypothetical protein
MFHPTHETMLRPGLREMGDHWRTVSTFLEVRFETRESAAAWAQANMSDDARKWFRGAAVPGLIQPA